MMGGGGGGSSHFGGAHFQHRCHPMTPNFVFSRSVDLSIFNDDQQIGYFK